MNTGGGVATFAGVKAWCAVLATSSVLVEQLEKVYAPLIDGIIRRQHDHPFVLGLQATITPHSGGITIINVGCRDLVERVLMQLHVQDYFNGGSSPNSQMILNQQVNCLMINGLTQRRKRMMPYYWGILQQEFIVLL
ncbi:hypothetical protein RDI58_005558 [Solanum bulbocastanum]|uniref:Uncharacterized protein n=1 Tax=Solanum bulbocastanum TaxID=147425 RepID=A0AAN8U7T5_SOLBU